MYLVSVFICLFVSTIYSSLLLYTVVVFFTAHVSDLFKPLCRSLFVSINDDGDDDDDDDVWVASW